MKNYFMQILYGIAGFSFVMGTLAMFAAKIAAYEGGTFFYRPELHWFNDSMTAFLLSINLVALLVLFRVTPNILKKNF